MSGLQESEAPFIQGVAVTPDDLGLTYRVYGKSGPFLVCTNGLGVSTFFWERFAAAFSDRFRVVVWDFVGHGRSSDPVDSARVSIEAFAEDLETVLVAIGVERAVLLGHSLGAQVNFEHYRRHPGRAQALVPTLGTYGRAVETFFSSPRLALRMAALVERILPRIARILPILLSPLVRSEIMERGARLLRLVDPQAPSMRGYFEHLSRIDLRVFAELLSQAQQHDASDLLPAIVVPTLIVAADRDLFVPLAVAQRMAAAIPGAELEILSGGSHAALFEQAERFHARVDRFLRERVVPVTTDDQKARRS